MPFADDLNHPNPANVENRFWSSKARDFAVAGAKTTHTSD
jgi:hypothetical protein